MSRRVEKDSSLARYLSEIGIYSILTKEEEQFLSKNYKDIRKQVQDAFKKKPS